MKYDRNRAIAVLVLCVILLLATSFYITPSGISDTDPSTYVVVPILMLPLLILFTFKSEIKRDVRKRDITIGALMFATFIALALFLRIYFSFYFISFRVDLLLIPLAIAALASLLFGVLSVNKFRGAMIYSMLASPAVLYPLFRVSGAFAQANTVIVYDIIRLFISGVQYSAPITIAANGYSIGIGQACVSVGIFIALAFFLIPIAYLYEGKAERKALWVASGIVIMLVLNLIRMASISLVWLAYGPNQTALFVHTFIGVILFYVVIALMILTSKFYGLGIGKASKKAVKKKKISDMEVAGIALAVAFSIIYLYLTLNYSSAMNISATVVSQRTHFNFTNVQVSNALYDMAARGNFNTLVIADTHGTYAGFSLTNGTVSTGNPITLLAMAPNKATTDGMLNNNIVIGAIDFFNRNGTTEQVYDLIYENTDYLVYDTQIPIIVGNQSTQITSLYVVIPAIELPNVTCSSTDPLYSAISNLANPSANQTVRRQIDSAECFSNRLIWG